MSRYAINNIKFRIFFVNVITLHLNIVVLIIYDFLSLFNLELDWYCYLIKCKTVIYHKIKNTQNGSDNIKHTSFIILKKAKKLILLLYLKRVNNI